MKINIDRLNKAPIFATPAFETLKDIIRKLNLFFRKLTDTMVFTTTGIPAYFVSHLNKKGRIATGDRVNMPAGFSFVLKSR